MSGAALPADHEPADHTRAACDDTPFAVTFFTDYKAQSKDEEACTVAALAARIYVETADAKAKLPWLKLARFGDVRSDKNSLRHDGNVISVSGIEVDYDAEKVPIADAVERLRKAGIRSIVYTSPSHTSNAPRWRVLCPFSQELPPKERAHMLGRLAGLFSGIGVEFSSESWTLSQSYFFGSVNDNPAHQVVDVEGTAIDLHDDLDAVWIGKPNTQTNHKGNGHDHHRGGSVDEAALREQIISGASYHTASVRLVGKWAQQGVPFLEAQQRLEALFDDVFPADRDERWKKRRTDIPRVVLDIYGSEARKQDTDPDSHLPEPPTDRWPDDPPYEATPPAADIACICLQATPIDQIPPRPWAYGRFLLFGSAAVIGAMDGVGKGLIATTMALAMITGRPLLGEHVWRTGPVVIVSYEDDETEWQRRIAAACLHHSVDYNFALANIHFIHRTSGRVVFACRGPKGETICPDSDAIIRSLRTVGAVMLIVDPFNSAHAMDDGNNNVLIARVASEISRIAHEANVTALVLHHLRKGSVGAIDDLMGATSLRANFRSCRILQRMSPEDASMLGVGERERFRFVRIASTKENYAPPPDKADWIRLESVRLDNGADIYPDGDSLAVATTWTPPTAFAGLDLATIKDIFDHLRAGPGDGWHYSPEPRAKHWAGKVIMESGDKTHKQATAILKTWTENDVLRTDDYRNPNRDRAVRIVLNDSKVADILAPLRASNDPDD